jgi:hypothetical protein
VQCHNTITTAQRWHRCPHNQLCEGWEGWPGCDRCRIARGTITATPIAQCVKCREWQYPDQEQRIIACRCWREAIAREGGFIDAISTLPRVSDWTGGRILH